jgi:hypothetical protein
METPIKAVEVTELGNAIFEGLNKSPAEATINDYVRTQIRWAGKMQPIRQMWLDWMKTQTESTVGEAEKTDDS